MPAMERVLEIRGEAFADDVDALDEMCSWSEDSLVAYFESGGEVLPSVHAAPSIAAHATLPLRFLSLHGGGTNANINRMQMSRMNKALRDAGDLSMDEVKFEYFEGTRPWTGDKDPSLEKMFPGQPFFGWYGVENTANISSGSSKSYIESLLDPSVEFTYLHVEESLDRLDRYIEAHGPFDGLIGFSQGGIMVTMLTARRLQRAASGIGLPPTWRVIVLIASLAPRCGEYACFMPEPATPPIADLACVCIAGCKDPYIDIVRKNKTIYGNLHWFEHSGGHEAPKDAEVNQSVAKAVLQAVGFDRRTEV